MQLEHYYLQENQNPYHPYQVVLLLLAKKKEAK